MFKLKTQERIYATAEQEASIPDSPISSCCGSSPKGNGDCDTSDFGICSSCHDHCDYGYFDEDNTEWYWDNDKKQFFK